MIGWRHGEIELGVAGRQRATTQNAGLPRPVGLAASVMPASAVAARALGVSGAAPGANGGGGQ